MTDPDLSGPYLPQHGEDAYGHHVNRAGRCEQINTGPEFQCPNREQQREWFARQERAILVSVASGYDVQDVESYTDEALIEFILDHQFPTV